MDPAQYFTAPGLAWDVALKVTNVELELLSDMDMLLMVEKDIRGGVSRINNRYGKANNKYMYMGDRFDASKPSKYITYLEANNLYRWAMSKPLPTHGFEWMKPSELENLRNHFCILEVDLEYPMSLHDWHNDFPLAPEGKKVNKVKKLIPKLMNNSVSGKTMENIRNRVDIKLVYDDEQAEKLSDKPNFDHCNIFSEDLVAIHMKKTRLFSISQFI